MHPVVAIGVVLGILGGLFAALRVYGIAAKPHPEVLRKAMHIGMGLVTLTFPWLFNETWPVWLLAALAVTALFAVRHVQALRGSVGQVLHGVKRDSTGELCFPIAVATVFELARGDWVLYLVPILLLTLADALAALIGVRYGQMHYSTVEGKTKSIEGSVAFFVVAFNATLITILAGTYIGRIESVFIALQIGILVAMVEAVAWKGLDNLLVPVAAFMLLRYGFWSTVPELTTRLAVLALLVIAIALWRRRTALDASGLIAAVLVGFLTWTIGGAAWLVASLAAFLSYGVIWPQVDRSQRQSQRPGGACGKCSADDCARIPGPPARCGFSLPVGRRVRNSARHDRPRAQPAAGRSTRRLAANRCRLADCLDRGLCALHRHVLRRNG